MVSNYYKGAIFGSVVGGILLLAFDFAGWNSSNYYLGVFSYGWIWIDSPSGFLALGTFAALLFYVAYQSYNGTKGTLDDQKLDQIYKISRGTFVAILACGLLFIIIISFEDVWWWLDTGFYGGAIGSGIATYCLRMIKNQ